MISVTSHIRSLEDTPEAVHCEGLGGRGGLLGYVAGAVANLNMSANTVVDERRSRPDSSVDPSGGLFLVLAVANAIGYVPSTCMPVWVGQIAAAVGWPAWSGGTLATLQLGMLTIGNISAAQFIGRFAARTLASCVALGAALGFLIMGTLTPVALVAGSIISGLCCGCLLAIANSMAAGFPRAQHAFAMLQLVLVLLGVILFFTLPRLLQAHGVAAVFIVLGGCALLSSPLLTKLPGQRSPQMAAQPYLQLELNWRPAAALLALALALASQTAIMACVFEAGVHVGLNLATVGTYMSGAALLCLLYPFAARLLGERVGLVFPLAASTLLLGLAAAFIMHAFSRTLFFVLLTALLGLPLFILPYVLALLARFDRSGRWAAIGPGFLMTGVAIGPSIAAFVRSRASLEQLGPLMAIMIVIASAIFFIAGRSPLVPARVSH